MSENIIVDIPLNRVEGDLELKVEIRDGVAQDAWSSGVMFRGFENLLVGRGALDGIVITPRICGICSTAHLAAASAAVDQVAQSALPPNAVIARNLALMVEHVQSDMRHSFLMFAADFVDPAYRDLPLYAEAVRRYQPLKGDTAVDVVRETKEVLGIIGIIAGHWPHTPFMVPGGIANHPSLADLQECRYYLRRYRAWYERRILGCSIERWLAVDSAAALDAWLDASAAHRDGELGFFIRYCRSAGIDRIGAGERAFLSYGSLPLPAGTKVKGRGTGATLVAAGFARGAERHPFSPEKIAEHVARSWFEDPEQGGRHPMDGETRPYASGREGDKYSWAKAPRYDGHSAETGTLAEMVVGGHPLFLDLLDRGGPTALVRALSRVVRAAECLPAMECWLDEIKPDDTFCHPVPKIEEGQGFGLVHAARGALGHWVKIEEGKIRHYQIIAPTTWNASPRDGRGTRGPLEAAIVGTRVADAENPIEVAHLVRSFDPCLVCTVHALRRDRPAPTRRRIG